MLCAMGLAGQTSLPQTMPGVRLKKKYEVRQEEVLKYQEGYERYCSYLNRIIG